MPAVTDIFRFRFRTTPKIPLCPSEDDTDRSSSPEHLPPKSAVRGHKATTSVSRPSDKKDVVRHADPVCLPTAAPSSGKQPTSAAHDVKVTLVRRVTSKLHIAIPKSRSTPASDSRSPPQTDSRRPRNQTSRLFVSPTSPLPNSFVSRERREAALRERGLLPPKKDLSQQERDEDARLPVVPLCSSTEPNRAIDGRTKGMMSLAEKIKQEWVAHNRDKAAQACDSELDSSTCSLPPYSPGGARSPSDPPQEQNAHETLSSNRVPSPLPTQVPLPASPTPPEPLSAPDTRPSFSSSLPPLSMSLEVLPEEQDREGPFTPPPSASPPNVYIQGQTVTGPGIVISTVVDAHNAEDADESPTQTMVESPVSGAFVSLLHPHILDTCAEEPDDVLSPSVSFSPPRKHTSDVYERGRGSKCQRPTISTCTSLSPPTSMRSPSLSPTTTVPVSRSRSRLGKVSSFTNLRRSVSTSLRSISNYSHRSTTPSSDAASGMTGEATLRTPVSPTMHNRASIWFEMRAVEDPESRRLCEMAFLD
ncbi:hypothetical protein EV401DRAFT_2049980 [Pisolithus croceorrhizus]|nr:hypothetical protein EV401DRAFT_2049980 [Pisolithus croceorrhizus]